MTCQNNGMLQQEDNDDCIVEQENVGDVVEPENNCVGSSQIQVPQHF